jgi:hypothetical protein
LDRDYPAKRYGVQSDRYENIGRAARQLHSLHSLFRTNGRQNELGRKIQFKWGDARSEEGGRSRVNGHTIIAYNLIATGLPRDVNCTLWMKPVGNNPQAVADAFINKNGLVVNLLADPAHNVAEDPINLKVVAGRGEPKQFAVISNDGQYQAFGQVVPFPMEKTGGACNISVTMAGANYSGVFVVVTGLQPKEDFQTSQQSGSEATQTKETAAEDSSYSALIFPFVKGHSSGKLRFKVAAKACAVAIEVPWGQGSYAVQ